MNDPSSGLDSEALARLVHDARSHLRTVLVTAQLLQRREHSPADLQEAVRKIVRAGKELDSLLTSSAYFGTLAEARQALLRPVALSTVLQGLLLDQKPMLQEKGGELHVDGDPEGDVPAGLLPILRELVKNSIRFASGKRLHIRIELTASAGRLTVLVVDNGEGIPHEFADQVFKPFHRLHTRETVAGCGLGLSTARRIADICNGTIEILPSTSGTIVEISWPLIS